MRARKNPGKNWLYRSTIFHMRHGEKENSFRYDSLFICFPLSRVDELKSTLFGVNHFSLFSYHDADHGNGGDPQVWIKGVLASEGLHDIDSDIWLMTLPRILGFVFNPVSFWYCHNRAGALMAVLCEVNNTFGERHCYLVQSSNGQSIANDAELCCRKVFHVSPFYPVHGEYRFRFAHAENHRRAAIDYYQGDMLSLKTGVSGMAMPLTDANLLKTFARLGFATMMIVARIHWQALKLWLKGIHFYRKPEPPHKEISS